MPALHWFIDHFDRIIALAALVIAVLAIMDVRKLFEELERRDNNTEIQHGGRCFVELYRIVSISLDGLTFNARAILTTL